MIIDNIRGIIFDMDGTLLDSIHVWKKCQKWFLENHKIPPNPRLDYIFIHKEAKKLAEILKSDYRIGESVEECAEQINNYVLGFYKNSIALKANVKATLLQLKSRNIKMVVATASDRNLANEAFLRLGIKDFFLAILGAETFPDAKANPEIYRAALKALGCKKDECLVVEDSISAMTTAKQDGFRVAAVKESSMECFSAKIKEMSDYYLNDISELLA